MRNSLKLIEASSEIDEKFHRLAFFKIIKHGLNIEEVCIPTPFWKKIRERESDTVIMNGPFGGHWNVQLSRRNKMIYLRDGWKKFFTDHSLTENDWLLFKYCGNLSGNLTFSVQAFDKSGLEKTRTYDFEEQQEVPIPSLEKKSKRDRTCKPYKSSVQVFDESELEKIETSHFGKGSEILGSSLEKKSKRGRPCKQQDVVMDLYHSKSSADILVEGNPTVEEKTNNPNKKKQEMYSSEKNSPLKRGQSIEKKSKSDRPRKQHDGASDLPRSKSSEDILGDPTVEEKTNNSDKKK